MITANFDIFARATVERMLNSVVAGGILFLVFWAILRLCRRQSSATKFAILSSLLGAMAATPLAYSLLSHISESGATLHAAVRLPEWFAPVLFGLWLLIAAGSLARILAGYVQLRKVRRSATPIELATLPNGFQRQVADCRSRPQVTILVSELVSVPTAMGFLRPAIVIPCWALQELEPEQLNTVLLHEFAHLQRWDDWTNLSQKLLCALFFFHPAIWWIDRRLSLEREMACDDMVLSATDNPRVYAQCLVALAEKSFFRRTIALAQAAVHRLGHVSLRVSHIMDNTRPRATGFSFRVIGTVAALATVFLGSISYAPTLVGFASSPQVPWQEISTSTANNIGAAVIPATLKLGPTALAPSSALQKRSRRSPRATPVTVTYSVPAKKTSLNTPRVIPAKSLDARPASHARQAMLVVVEDRIVDGSGQVVWGVAVWRLDFVQQASPQLRTEVMPSSI